jgi:aryl-alcohol dehydrogenase-like predicted oxidoreductase
MMKHIPIAGTDLTPTCLCMGTHLMGSDVNERDSFAILDAYWEAGGNFLDTAHAYADWAPGCLHRNVSETTIGRWLCERKNRGAFIVGTKGGWSSDGTPFSELLSREALLRQIERSRACLQVDMIDLYWLHRDDPARPVAYFIDFLNEQVQTKTIRHFGCSNWTARRIQEAAEYAAKHGVKGFVANQMWWSLATPDLDAYNRSCNDTAVGMDSQTRAYHDRSKLTAVPFSSQAKGFFNKLAAAPLEKLPDFYRSLYGSAENLVLFERVKKVGAERSLSITQVALGYLLSQPFPVIPIVSCRHPAAWQDTLTAVEVTLPPETVRYLEEG